jgi:hypothetical protein
VSPSGSDNAVAQDVADQIADGRHADLQHRPILVCLYRPRADAEARRDPCLETVCMTAQHRDGEVVEAPVLLCGSKECGRASASKPECRRQEGAAEAEIDAETPARLVNA